MNTPIPIEHRSGVALGLVLATWRTPAAGEPTIAGYWNFAEGAYDAGPFDRAKHIKPMTRVGVDGSDPDFKLQVAAVAKEAFEGFRPSIRLYELTAAGDRADLARTNDPTAARAVVGLSS